jgi:hypothetical protein
MSGHEQDTDIRDSTPNANGPDGAAGGMGVSSEREGHTGPRQHSTDGVKDTSATDEPLDDAPDEGETEEGGEQSTSRQRSSGEIKPEGLPAHAGYPSLDPRSEDKPYEPRPKL